MQISGAPIAADGIGEARIAADLLEESAGKAAAEDVGHNVQGCEIFIAALAAKLADLEEGLFAVGFVSNVYAGRLLFGDAGEGRGSGTLHGPIGEERREFSFDCGRVDVALD